LVDTVSIETRSRIMSRIRSESGIEILPERLKGLRLRRHPKGVFGNPDFGNKARRVAVFIDGCFWHGCPEHYREPRGNADFWREKVERNRARDKAVAESLGELGWMVIRIWEHELKQEAPG
jgi:DNA mismatch endonuclease (patch repair protein)